jgi:hypothetical protein
LDRTENGEEEQRLLEQIVEAGNRVGEATRLILAAPRRSMVSRMAGASKEMAFTKLVSGLGRSSTHEHSALIVIAVLIDFVVVVDLNDPGFSMQFRGLA